MVDMLTIDNNFMTDCNVLKITEVYSCESHQILTITKTQPTASSFVVPSISEMFLGCCYWNCYKQEDIKELELNL